MQRLMAGLSSYIANPAVVSLKQTLAEDNIEELKL